MNTEGVGSRLRSVVPWCAVGAVLAWYLAPLWRNPTYWAGTFDWGYFFFLQEVSRKTVLEYGQFPRWNPYYCGGAVHLANPQTFFSSLTFIPVLIFGTPIGMRIMVTAAIVLAFDSMRQWSRARGLSAEGAMLAGTGYAICGALAYQLGGGHVGWFGFALFPYVLLCFERALDGSSGRGRSGWIAGAALLMAWIAGHWGVYQYPYICMLLAVYGLLLGVQRRRVKPALGIVAALVAVSVALAAFRILPLVEFIREHPRTILDEAVFYPWEWWDVYVERHPNRRFWGARHYQWPEYANYFGPVGTALFFVGAVVVVRWRREQWPALVTLGLFALLTLGNIPGAPWWWLRKLPFFDALRVPSRFTIIVGMMMCLCIGLAVDHLARWARARGNWTPWALGAVALVVAAYVVDVAQFNRRQWTQSFTTPPPTDVVSPDFHNVSGIASAMYRFPRVNRGSLSCFEESPLPISPALNAHLGIDDQERPADPTVGSVKRVRWTPNRIALHVDFDAPGRVVVNQNHDRHWRASVGRVVSDRGRLAVDVPAGARALELVYWPRSLTLGLAISGLGFAGLIAMLVAARTGLGIDGSSFEKEASNLRSNR